MHGDLRPACIFLDVKEDACIGDYDVIVKTGEQLMVASELICRLDENCETPLAGPLSEQFALASCIYTIPFGRKPYHDLEARVTLYIKATSLLASDMCHSACASCIK